jgi:myosin-5
MDTLAFWMSNTFRLLCNMRQFSGEARFKVAGGGASSQQRTLANFDLQQYRTVLADLLVQIYTTVIKNIEHQLEPMIVPGLLEHESIPGLAGP